MTHLSNISIFKSTVELDFMSAGAGKARRPAEGRIVGDLSVERPSRMRADGGEWLVAQEPSRHQAPAIQPGA